MSLEKRIQSLFSRTTAGVEDSLADHLTASVKKKRHLLTNTLIATAFAPFAFLPYPTYPLFYLLPQEWTGPTSTAYLEMIAPRLLFGGALLSTHLYSKKLHQSFKRAVQRGNAGLSLVRKIASSPELFSRIAFVAGAGTQLGYVAFFQHTCQQSTFPSDLLSPVYAGFLSSMSAELIVKGTAVTASALQQRFSKKTAVRDEPLYPAVKIAQLFHSWQTREKETELGATLTAMMKSATAEREFNWQDMSNFTFERSQIKEQSVIQQQPMLPPFSHRTHLLNGVLYFLKDNYKEAQTEFDLALKLEPDNSLFHLVHAQFQYAVAQKKGKTPQHQHDFLKGLRTTTRLLLADNDLDWKRIELSRNEVFSHQLFPFIIKKNVSKKRIDREANITRMFAEKFPDNTSLILNKYAKDNYYFLMIESAGKTLEKIVQERQYAADDFYEISKLLGNIHRYASSLFAQGKLQNKPLQDKQHYTHRLQHLLFSHLVDSADLGTLPERFSATYAPLNDLLFTLPLAPYKDATLRNWVREKNIVAIDFETLHLVPEHFDFINLIEFGREYLTSRQKKNAAELYLKYREGYSGAAAIQLANPLQLRSFNKKRHAFFDTYAIAATHKHLELLGHNLRDAQSSVGEQHADKLASQRYHYEKAMVYLSQVKERQPALSQLESCLAELSAFLPAQSSENCSMSLPADYASSPLFKMAAGAVLATVALVSSMMSFSAHNQYAACLPDDFFMEFSTAD